MNESKKKKIPQHNNQNHDTRRFDVDQKKQNKNKMMKGNKDDGAVTNIITVSNDNNNRRRRRQDPVVGTGGGGGGTGGGREQCNNDGDNDLRLGDCCIIIDDDNNNNNSNNKIDSDYYYCDNDQESDDDDDDDFILPALRIMMMGGASNITSSNNAPTTTDVVDNNNNRQAEVVDNDDDDDDEFFQSMAEEYVLRLQRGVPILLDRLVTHLSKLPEVDDDYDIVVDDDDDVDEEEEAQQEEHQYGQETGALQQKMGKQDDDRGLFVQGHDAGATTTTASPPPRPPQDFGGIHSSSPSCGSGVVPPTTPPVVSLDDPLYVPPPSSNNKNSKKKASSSSSSALLSNTTKISRSKNRRRTKPKPKSTRQQQQLQQQQQEMQGGLSLPASAIAWLSNELYPPPKVVVRRRQRQQQQQQPTPTPTAEQTGPGIASSTNRDDVVVVADGGETGGVRRSSSAERNTQTDAAAADNEDDDDAAADDDGDAAVVLEGLTTKISNCSLISSSPWTTRRRNYNNNSIITATTANVKGNNNNNIVVDAADEYDDIDVGNSVNDFWMDDTTREKLILLTFLLPRVKFVRITRQEWPPELPEDADGNYYPRSDRSFGGGRGGRIRRLLSRRRFWKRIRRATSRSTRRRPGRHHDQNQNQPPVDVNCSFLSVNSAVTVDSMNHLVNNQSNVDSQGVVSSRRYPTRNEFLMYWHRLQTRPDIDVRVFPRTKALVLDGVPLAWVHNLIDIQSTLEVLNVHKAAIFRLPPLLFHRQQQQQAVSRTRGSRKKLPPRLPRACFYQNLTHLKLDHCSLGELSGLPASLSRLSNLKYLSLQHNEIRSEKTVLTGLRQSSDTLVLLDLRHNFLSSLTNAFLYLGGQLKTIKLSHNNLTTTRGLEKCYALQELWLDNNSFTSMIDLSGLARLPELKLLKIHSNPVTTLGTEDYDPDCRLQLWTWFQEERRCTSPLEMPKLWDGTTVFGPVPTQREWELIEDGSFSNVVLPEYCEQMPVHRMANTLQSPIVAVDAQPSSMPVELETPRVNVTINKGRLRRVSKKIKTRKAEILSSSSERAAGSHKTILSVAYSEGSCVKASSTSSSGMPLVAFSLKDVLLTLQQNRPEDLKSSEAISIEQMDSTEEEIEFSDALQDIADIKEQDTPCHLDGVDSPDQFDDISEEKIAVSEDMDNSISNSNNGQINDALPEEKDQQIDSRAKSHKVDLNVEVSSEIHPTHKSTIDLPIALSRDKLDEDRLFPRKAGKGNGSTITLHLGANSTLSDEILKADWEDLITRASKGMIPDGIPTVPIKDVPLHDVEPVFPDQAVDMLEGDESTDDPINTSRMSGIDPAESRETSMGVDSRLPEHIWKDENSVLSSLGTSRDGTLPKNNKFHMAEENSVYDGPETCRDLRVTDNLPLYFSGFVFPSSVPDVPKSVLDEMEEDEDDWQAVMLYYPRIQLWPEDRRWLERTHVTSSLEIADWSANRERLVRVWEEYVIPCGKPGLRRLPPNRRIRLGFHGDKLFEGASPDAYAECRKVLLCLSSKAFYIILEEDPVTMSHAKQAGKKRRFPLPIDKDLLFRDAPWPHAVARHSLRDLVSVSIGFEFQRLTFRFRNPAVPKSDPFVYVVLTGNKASTVKILQEVQKLANEATAGVSGIASDTTIAIENDSQLVFDRLNEALAPNQLGTVLHYQILHQRWKHGDRGIVRRAFIVTETKVLLLDEDYVADGHNVANISVAGDKMADVEYRIVDEATLKQVTEVQAAGDDPKAITLIISPLSSLSRTHRWRLVCRDRDGAERLVDDVRKALAMLSEGLP